MQIGIDVGRSGVKACSVDNKVYFESRVGSWYRRNLYNDDNYSVSINGEKFFVGELAKESFDQREMKSESKIHEETKILFLTALGLLARPNEKITIITGLPINQHNPETKTELFKLLVGKYDISIERYVPSIEVVVSDIQVVPEMAGGYWDLLLDVEGNVLQSVFLNSKIRGIDIGSRTVNYATINSRKYINKESGTLNYGLDELLLVNSNPSPIECERFARKIIADLSNKWLTYNPSTDIIYLLGGGALYLHEYMKKHFSMVYVASDPIFANASGYLKMGVARCKQIQTAK